MRVRLWAGGAAIVVTIVLTGVAVAGEIALATPADPASAAMAVALACVGLSWFAVGVYLARRRPRHPLGWMFLVVGLLTQAGVAGEIVVRAGWVDWVGVPVMTAVDFVVGLAIFLLVGLLPILYPSGRIVGVWAGILSVVTIFGAFLSMAQVWRANLDPTYTWPFGPPAGAHEPWWVLWLPFLAYGVGVVGGWVLCLIRLVRARHPERQQLAWLLIAVMAVLVATLLSALLGVSSAAAALQAVALLLLPVAVAVGIVRYQLLGIETMVPRVITAGALVALVAAAYLAVMALSGAGLTGEVLPSVIVAAIVAIALLPLQDRLRRVVDRFVYGKAADPLRAVADLGTAVTEGTGADALNTLLAELVETFRANGARITDMRGTLIAQTGGVDTGDILSSVLAVAGEPIGTLELAARPRGERYSRSDWAMLDAMAGTVALAVHAAALADELERQRDAVFEASALARDRLQRDLHDGLGPSLTGLRLGLQALADAQDAGDRPRSAYIAGVLRTETDRAVMEVRRLIDDMRPLDLDNADLAVALRRRLAARPGQIPVELRIADVGPLPPDIEDSAFRIIVEAVANAQKHSAASSIVVTVDHEGGRLRAWIGDDGRGMPRDAPRGVGLPSMQARARAIGGSIEIDSSAEGTVVTLVVPVKSRLVEPVEPRVGVTQPVQEVR